MKQFVAFVVVLAILAMAGPVQAGHHYRPHITWNPQYRGNFYGSELARTVTDNGCMVSGMMNLPDYRCLTYEQSQYGQYGWTPYGVGYPPGYPVYQDGWHWQRLSPVAAGIGGAVLGAVIVHAIDKKHDGTYHKVRNGQASVQITNAPEPTLPPPPAPRRVQKICNKSPYSVKIFSDDTFIGTLPPNMEADRPAGHVELESTSISCDLAFPKVDGNIHVICQ